MSRIRSKNTRPELKIRKIIADFGIKYRLNVAKLPGKPDIVIAKQKKAVFINGCFWHQHENCKKASMPKSNKRYWKDKLKRNIQRQGNDIKKLKKEGWKIFTVWECQTEKNNLIKRLKKFIDEKK